MINAAVKYLKIIIIGLFAITLISCNDGSTAVSGGSVTPTSTSGIIFGNNAGLMYKNGTLLPGNAKVTTIDSKQIYGVAIDANHNMYAATQAGKVYKYFTESKTWVNLPGKGAGGSLDGASLTPSSVNQLVLNNNKLYAGTSQGNVFLYTNNQWNTVGGSVGSPIITLIFDQYNNIYVGCNNGIVYEYTNNQWVALASIDGTQVNALTINDGILYASTTGNTNGQVYKYNTTNSSWDQIRTLDQGSINALASNDGILYAGTQTGKVYESQAGRWVALSDPDGSAIQEMTTSNGTLYTGTNGGSNNGQVYTYESTGDIWHQVSTLSNGQITALAVESNRIYAGTINQNANVVLGNLYIYESGTSFWYTVGGATALDGSSIFSTTIDADGNYYAGTQNNVYKYSESTQVWLQQGNLPDQTGVNALITFNGITYAGTFAGNVYYQVANISNWTQLGTELQNSSSITSFAVKSDGTLFASTAVYGETAGNVFKYSVAMESWVIVSGAGQDGSLDSSQVLTLNIDESNNLYAGTQGPNNYGQVWEYPESKEAWELVGTGSLDLSSVQSVKTDSNGVLYAGTEAGNVFKFVGAWQQVGNSALDGSPISALTFSDNVLYATTIGGNIWYYTPSTNIWTNAFYGPGIGIGSNNSIVGTGI